MANFVKKDSELKNQDSFYYAEVEKDSFLEKVDHFFTARGYELVEGDKADGVYEKGNRVLRILLGAFYKYFKFKVHIEFNGQQEAKLSLVKATSGFSGGAIGVAQVKTERKNLEEALTVL